MSDNNTYEQDESTELPTHGSRNEEFFIDDYSHLRLSYYQHRDDITLDLSGSSYQDSAYSTNASTNESFPDALNRANINSDDSTNTANSSSTNNTDFTSTTYSKDLEMEERRKLREYYISQIPDLPHPSYTVASIIASASHRMDPTNRFTYKNKIEQGTRVEDDMATFKPERRSTLKPDPKQ